MMPAEKKRLCSRKRRRLSLSPLPPMSSRPLILKVSTGRTQGMALSSRPAKMPTASAMPNPDISTEPSAYCGVSSRAKPSGGGRGFSLSSSCRTARGSCAGSVTALRPPAPPSSMAKGRPETGALPLESTGGKRRNSSQRAFQGASSNPGKVSGTWPLMVCETGRQLREEQSSMLRTASKPRCRASCGKRTNRVVGLS